MHRLSLLITAVAVCSSIAMKMTPEIQSCMAQVESRVGDESDGKMKSGVQQLLDSLKVNDIMSAQKVVRTVSEAERATTLNKYMVEACSPLKTCFVCPLELA